ncbi:hypothetical protein, partial [Roseibium sp. RKSG952]|uniref:hypothetical protein n=1 Tax=Roseibium sp. RKSG952 TaxID=2529384 RepID=UPI001AD8EC30
SGYGPKQFQELRRLGATSQAPGLWDPDQIRLALSDTPNHVDIMEVNEEIRRIRFENPVSVLRHLRNTGVNAVTCQTWTKSRLEGFCRNYTAMSESGVLLTYHPVWVIARKRR